MDRRIRRIIAIMAIFALLLVGVPAQGQAEIRVVLGGQQLEFDVPPAIVDGRVLVPLRRIFEALGAKIAYDAATRRITAWKGPITVQLTVDEPTVRVDDSTKELDVAPRVVDGRTLVPLRFISEALGGEVSWNSDTRTATIVTPSTTVNPQDALLSTTDLPGEMWTEIKDPGERDGWKKILISHDETLPYAWFSSALAPVGAGSDLWVQERTCRSGESEIARDDPPLVGDAVKFCQSTGPDGKLVVSAYVARGEYVLTLATSLRTNETAAEQAASTLEYLAMHQLLILGQTARGQVRPPQVASLQGPAPQRLEQPQGAERPPQQPGRPPEQAPVKPEGEQLQEPGQRPALETVQLPRAPAPLAFTAPATINVTAGAGEERVLFSFCDPEPTSLTSPCGPMPSTRNPSGGNPPYHFTLGAMGGFPPMGVSLLKDGHLFGDPDPATAGRTYPFRVCATDLSGKQVCGDVSVVVAAPLRLTIPLSLPEATEGVPYDYQWAATGGNLPYLFSVQQSAPPDGMRLDATGRLSGRPGPGTGGREHFFILCVVDETVTAVCEVVFLKVNRPRPPGPEQWENTTWTGTFTAERRPGTVTIRFGPAQYEGTSAFVDVVEGTLDPAGHSTFRSGRLACFDYATQGCTRFFFGFSVPSGTRIPPNERMLWPYNMAFTASTQLTPTAMAGSIGEQSLIYGEFSLKRQ